MTVVAEQEPADDGSPTLPAWLPTRSEMGRRVARLDWSTTPLGPLDEWALPLRNAVATCLSSNFPVLICWGPDLIKIYNDGYGEMVGPDKHPAALGRPARDVWPEIWDEIGPMFDAVLSTGVATWSKDQLLQIHRNGFAEECYFNFSYSPIYGEDGTIVGVLDISIETTEAVVSERRLRCIADLSSQLALADAPTEACVAAVSALSWDRSDIVAADVFLCIGDDLVPVASNRRYVDERVPIEIIDEVVASGRTTVLGETDDGRARFVVIPLASSTVGPGGALVLSLSSQLPFDAAYRRFTDVLGQTLDIAIERAQRRAEELGELQHVNETLQRAMLPSVSETQAFVAHYLPAANQLSVGGDWYDVVELPGDRRALIVGDCVGHDLSAATAMAQLRSASRALLLEDHDPASAIASLDAFARTVEGGQCASVLCVIVDHATRTLTFCNAGHPPALLRSSVGVEALLGAEGPVLGIGAGVERRNEVRPFAEGDVLVLYTDGLVERRNVATPDQVARLVEIVRASHHADDHADLPALADRILVEFLDGTQTDDVVLLVKGLQSAT